MPARIRQFLSWLTDTFWLIPGVMVVLGIATGLTFVEFDRQDVLPHFVVNSPWIYNGSATGARALLGAVASSTIGVAGTAFSITIAALSLAAGQMGPRLLRNFTHDRGNQLTLGTFLGTFVYALMVIRSVRSADEGEFIPHFALTFAIALAVVCVCMLVFFIEHMAGRINVETVIDLVSHDVGDAIERLTQPEAGPKPPSEDFWDHAVTLRDSRRGYLQHLDADGLADWANQNGTALRLLVRPGGYVFPGAPIALCTRPVEGATEAIVHATALSSQQASSDDLEYAIRQVVEVAVRALSPGINDPMTAIGALDRLGAALCDLVPAHLPSGLFMREGQLALVVPAISYEGLTDTMFNLIRQNAAGSPAVLIHQIEVLTAVASCERDPERVRALKRHAGLAMSEAERSDLLPHDLADVRQRYEALLQEIAKSDPHRDLDP